MTRLFETIGRYDFTRLDSSVAHQDQLLVVHVVTSFLELDYSKLSLACLLAKGKTHEVKGFERSENQANEVRRLAP